MNLNRFGFSSVEEFLFSFAVALFGALTLPAAGLGCAVYFAVKRRKTAAVAAILAGAGLLATVRFSCTGPAAPVLAVAEVSHRLLFGGWAPGTVSLQEIAISAAGWGLLGGGLAALIANRKAVAER
ncbi:MAG: hypothetical protein AB1330_11710 [Bacillota bacterium]